MNTTLARSFIRPAFLVLTLLASGVVRADNNATEPDAPGTRTEQWRAQKCSVFAKTRDEMLEIIPRGTLGNDFAKAEEDYMNNGCRGRAYACPKSRIELNYANKMSMAMMSHGLSGTFLPCGCREDLE